MTICLRRKLANVHDLLDLELSLRSLYNTTDGVHCQALLTTAYQSWRHKIVRQWLSNIRDGNELVPVETYLPGYKLVFCNEECAVHRILPPQCNSGHNITVCGKRKAYETRDE
jgi:hypothetical protein